MSRNINYPPMQVEESLVVIVPRRSRWLVAKMRDDIKKFNPRNQHVRQEDLLRSKSGYYMGCLAMVDLAGVPVTQIDAMVRQQGYLLPTFYVVCEMLAGRRLVGSELVAVIGSYTDLDGYKCIVYLYQNARGHREIRMAEYDQQMPGGKLIVMRKHE